MNSSLDALKGKGGVLQVASLVLRCVLQAGSGRWEDGPEGDGSMPRECLLAPWKPPCTSEGTGDGWLRPHTQLGSVEQMN